MAFFNRNRNNNPKIHMETQKTLNSQTNLEYRHLTMTSKYTINLWLSKQHNTGI